MNPTPWNIEQIESPAQLQINAELDRIEREAVEKRAAAQAALRQESERQAKFRNFVAAGQTAWQRLFNARDQLQIIVTRRADAVGQMDALIGGDSLTTAFFKMHSASPLLDGTIIHAATNMEHPFLHFGRIVAAMDAAIARVEAALPALEKAESDAREAARLHAEANGFDATPFGGKATEAAPSPFAPVSEISDTPADTSVEPVTEPERFPGKRKPVR